MFFAGIVGVPWQDIARDPADLIPQLTGDALTACRTEADGSPALTSMVDGGWCYVDAQTGNPNLFASCPQTERRMIRFIGNGEVQPSATAFITCSVESSGK